MPESAAIQPPRAAYAGLMLVAVAAGLGLTAFVGYRIGGGAQTLMFALSALGIASLATFLPSIIVTRSGTQSWGLIVLGASMVRALGALVLGYIFESSNSLDRRPFWIGLVSGAALILVAESVAAIMILARIERDKQLDRGSTNSGSISTTSSTTHSNSEHA